MITNLKKIEFDYKAMKLNEIYFNKNISLLNEGVVLSQVRDVFGRDLMFGDFLEERPYTYNSLVTSIDGKIAFLDSPQGPLIAKTNKYAGIGSTVDYWILNLLRGSADAILCGTQSISKEVNTGGTGHCYDANITEYRIENGMSNIPWRIVVTLDGSDIPFEAAQFTHPEMPSFFYTTEYGIDNIRLNSRKDIVVLGPFSSIDDVEIANFVYDSTKSYVIVTSSEKAFNNEIGLKILKKIGVNKLLIESPTVTHIFMQEKILDELFINQSGIYVGGSAISIGQNCNAFTSNYHPHTELISIYMHSPHFIYSRYRLNYE